MYYYYYYAVVFRYAVGFWFVVAPGPPVTDPISNRDEINACEQQASVDSARKGKGSERFGGGIQCSRAESALLLCTLFVITCRARLASCQAHAESILLLPQSAGFGRGSIKGIEDEGRCRRAGVGTSQMNDDVSLLFLMRRLTTWSRSAWLV